MWRKFKKIENLNNIRNNVRYKFKIWNGKVKLMHELIQFFYTLNQEN